MQRGRKSARGTRKKVNYGFVETLYPRTTETKSQASVSEQDNAQRDKENERKKSEKRKEKKKTKHASKRNRYLIR